MESASACDPEGTKATLDEPSDHSPPGALSVPSSLTPPAASMDSAPREASEAPESTVITAADGPLAGISQFRSDTASIPAPPPPLAVRVTGFGAGSAGSATP